MREYCPQESAALPEEEKDYIRTILMDSVATEFFQPLNLIELNRDYLEMYLSHKKENYEEKKVREALDSIGSATTQMDRLMNNCLDLLECLQGHTRPQMESLDLWAMVRDIAENSREAAQRLGVGISLKAPGEESCIAADRSMAERVLLNLLSNALRASHSGGKITLALEKQAKGYCLSLSDEGVGVTPAFAAQAFTFRSRVPAQDRQLFLGGAGIGLYLCGEFCRLLGWQPSMHPGKCGTVVRIHIPEEQLVSGQRLVFHSEEGSTEMRRERIRRAVIRELCTVPGVPYQK